MTSLALTRSRRIALAGLGLYALIPRRTLHLDSDSVVDPDSGITFPRTIRVPGQFKSGPLELIGLGVRTVSFLGIQVYSIGFYADLTSPTLKITLPTLKTPDEKIEHIVRNSAVVLRIIPTRSTSYTHLRDAFMRALQGRLKLGTLSEDEAQAVAAPMRALKTLFPNSPLAKHASLDLTSLHQCPNTWVATELLLYYFAGNGPSPALKKTTVARLEAYETSSK
ncbi:chalcone-flavanone isomerase-domain-containing protein [Mycena galopus ATCC 62051]|nr:chalcone-flavanone isomerase-domain-containing protein [Mycena galopus ATCC 62051]